jgi:Zn-dependent M28 family amino/carboxypeptidase
MKNNFLVFILSLLLLTSCKQEQKNTDHDENNVISTEGMEQHIKTLASDEFQGRRPFTEGERKTLTYLEDQFKTLRLEPGNGNSYLQEVPMVEITAQAAPVMQVQANKTTLKLNGFDDYVLWTERTEPVIDWKNEQVVFAGFGIIAPEYNWNDYAGLDVKGKIVLVLVNDPGFGGADSTFFKGNTMTYYGRWTYKFEEAARQGAKGCLVIHNTVPAGYGFWVVQNNWNAPHLYLDPRGKNQYKCEGIGWVSMSAAEKIFNAAGLNFNEQQSRARQPGFKAVPLKPTFSTSMSVSAKYNTTYNVVAKLTGTDAPGEYVIYTAHWDHLGIGKPNDQGDSIYNGALDNAGGVATMLEIARAFASMKTKPKRTVVFLSVTAEEQGLWGSAYYAENPIYPIEKTVANLNMDFTNAYGKMKDVTVIGIGQSELEDYLREEAKKQGRYIAPEPNPVAGLYFRSDHFNFAKRGIPALFTGNSIDHVEHGKEYGQQRQDDYTKNRYHQPADAYNSEQWDLSGAVQDAQLLFSLGKRLANSNDWPQWKAGSEFKHLRPGKE